MRKQGTVGRGKAVARRRAQWRTPENSLHLLSLAGGWAGAWFAQQVLRHKTSKPSFQVMFWFTLLLHCVLAGTWLSLA